MIGGELVDLLDLQEEGDGRFIGPPSSTTRERMFGGQLLAQALAAACFTVDGRACHSLHAYFVRPGVPGRPTEYEVGAFHDGKRFCTRQVVGVQRDNVIFQLTASFHEPEGAREYSLVAPNVADPDSFPTEEERLAALREAIDPSRQRLLEVRFPVELIPLPGAEGERGTRRFWARARGELPPAPNFHRCALAYASDLGALWVCIEAIGAALGDPALEVASLDHAIWFHREARSDEWLLFDQRAVAVDAGRGLSTGAIFSRDGQLVASMAQEGVLRRRRDTG